MTGSTGVEEIRWSGPDGVPLVGERHRGPGDLVVLLHGGFQNRTAWRRAVVDLTQRGHDVVAYDLRGHGDSGRSAEGRYSVAAHADDLRALLRLLGRPAALVGASLGGGTALAVAGETREPERPGGSAADLVSALVLLDVVPRLEDGGRHRIHRFMSSNKDGFESLDEAAALIAGYAGRAPRSTDGLRRSLRLDDVGRYRWHWDPCMVEDGFNAYNEEHIQSQLAAASRLRVPTLLLRGERSDVVSEAGVAEFLAAAPSAQCRTVPKVGHMVAAMPNSPYIRAAADFLAEVHSDLAAWRPDEGSR